VFIGATSGGRLERIGEPCAEETTPVEKGKQGWGKITMMGLLGRGEGGTALGGGQRTAMR